MDFDGRTVGVRASQDDRAPSLNYDQCFVRDFAVCVPAFLLRGEHQVVRNFLLTTLSLQSKEEALEALEPRRGLMPASFRPVEVDGDTMLEGDYGEESIARVTPVDSVFWWLLSLRAYGVVTGDTGFAHREDVQAGICRILRLILGGSFEMFPTLLVPDGSFMIDRRMGVYGHPLEVQALFFAALRAASELLDDEQEIATAVEHRLHNLRHHVARYYWMDAKRLSDLRHMERDQYGEEVVNVFNVFPEAIPDWVGDWLPEDAGYLCGNVGPGRIDFRFFAQGNLLAVSAGLCDQDQATGISRLYEERWDDLVAGAPRIVYPALAGEPWRVLTGADTKNEPWCYHNGGWWPSLLWSFAPAAVTWGRTDLLERATTAMRRRIDDDDWPEYYDGEKSPSLGRRARRLQSWSMGAYVFAEACLEDPAACDLYRWPASIAPREADGDARKRIGRDEAAGGS